MFYTSSKEIVMKETPIILESAIKINEFEKRITMTFLIEIFYKYQLTVTLYASL